MARPAWRGAHQSLVLQSATDFKVKAVIIWLFSALLVLTQGASTSAAFAQRAPSCPRCACGRACCVRPANHAPTPLPAGPSSLLSLKQWQPALTLTIHLPPRLTPVTA